MIGRRVCHDDNPASGKFFATETRKEWVDDKLSCVPQRDSSQSLASTSREKVCDGKTKTENGDVILRRILTLQLAPLCISFSRRIRLFPTQDTLALVEHRGASSTQASTASPSTAAHATCARASARSSTSRRSLICQGPRAQSRMTTV